MRWVPAGMASTLEGLWTHLALPACCINCTNALAAACSVQFFFLKFVDPATYQILGERSRSSLSWALLQLASRGH